MNISIHAPPRGATCRGLYFLYRPPISIHAPPRGATREQHAAETKELKISIHAPPRGATSVGGFIFCTALLFQFTPLREGRLPLHSFTVALLYFNSRPSARGDCPPKAQSIPSRNFNSRPSARGDSNFAIVLSQYGISIHAPPRGATRFPCAHLQVRYFNSRPSARGDRCTAHRAKSPALFQFTPLREGRRRHATARTQARDFNSRPSARGDQIAGTHARRFPHFNSRPSARGDGKRYAISANLLFNPYKSAWLNNSATQFVEIILVIFHRIIA